MAIAELEHADQEGEAMRYRYFLAAPMSGLASEDYPAFRDWVMTIVDALESDGDRVYFAGRSIASVTEFNTPTYAAVHDLEAIKASEEFILLYPRRCHSSALFEAGIAVGLGQRVTVFTPDRKELVFMLQNTEAYELLEWTNSVRIIEYGDQPPVAAAVKNAL